ncbi:MAG: SPOR domain-containing protein [Chthoniobacteraceae bacterium]
MEQPITVATFNDREPAETTAARLREAGFFADVYDESNEQKWKLFNLKPRAHLRVRVHTSEETRALAQLAEWENDGVLARAVHCPECGSSRVEFPQFSRRTIMGALPAALAATGVIDQQFYCESCHFTWPAEPPKAEEEVDILNWPKGKTF